MEEIMLRVHSADLHDHVVQEIGECLETGLYTDLMLRCQDGHTLHAHKLVLSAVSPYLKMLLENNDWEDIQTLELPDSPNEIVSLLLEVIYNGVVEATIEDLRELILLGHSLYISIPLSDELIHGLELVLPPMPPLVLRGPPKLKQRPNFTPMMMAKPRLARPPMLKQPIQHSFAEKRKLMAPASMLSTSLPLPKLGKNSDHVCPICNSRYSNIGNFKQHMKMHDSDNLKEQRNVIIGEMVATCYDPSSSLYTCRICNSTYNHSGNFKQHLLKHERESGSISALLVAKASEAGATSLDDVLNIVATSNIVTPKPKSSVKSGGHPITRTPGRNLYTCEQCGRAFNHAGNYKQHMSSHMRSSMNGKPSPKSQKQMGSLHSSPASTPSPNKRFKTSSSSSFAVLSCPECDLEFPNADDLDNHISSAHNQIEVRPEFEDEIEEEKVSPKTKSFRCKKCPERFETEAWLTRHQMAFHNEDEELTSEEKSLMEWSPAVIVGNTKAASSKPGSGANGDLVIPTFKCKICGKKFLTKTKLSIHIKIHSAPEDHYRFPCDICGKKFTRPQHVNRHKLLHTGERPFHCVKCNQSFANEERFRYHIKTDCEAEEDVSGTTFGAWTTPEEVENGSDSFEYNDDSFDCPAPNVILSD